MGEIELGQLSWQAALTQGILVAIIVGLVQALKTAFLPSKFSMLAAYVIAVILGLAWFASEGGPFMGYLIGSLVAAQAASKTYDQTKGAVGQVVKGATSLLPVTLFVLTATYVLLSTARVLQL